MFLPTPSQSVSHKQFHQCVNHKKKLSLRHPLPNYGNFSFFQASLWLGVDKVLQKLTKSYKSELIHLFQCCIWIPKKCPRKTLFQHTVPPLPLQTKIYLVQAPLNVNILKQHLLIMKNSLWNFYKGRSEADSWPLRYFLWCCVSICNEVFI